MKYRFIEISYFEKTNRFIKPKKHFMIMILASLGSQFSRYNCRIRFFTKNFITQFIVRLDSSVTHLLTEISRRLDHYYMTNKVEGQYHDQVDVKTDYLAFKDRIELLLPRSELLKNFTFVQSNHLVPIELNLIKE